MTRSTAASPHPLDIALGKHIRTLRKRCEMFQSELAKAAGVTFQQVQQFERRHQPRELFAAGRYRARVEAPGRGCGR